MNFFNLGAPKLIPYAYVKLTDSLLKRWYTRSINHCSQLSTTGLSDHGSHSKSKWFHFGLWGDGVIIVSECSWFSFICIKHIYIYISSYIYFYVHALLKEEENQRISRIISCPLVNGLSFICYDGNILGKPLNMMHNTLELMSHHLMLIFWAS